MEVEEGDEIHTKGRWLGNNGVGEVCVAGGGDGLRDEVVGADNSGVAWAIVEEGGRSLRRGTGESCTGCVVDGDGGLTGKRCMVDVSATGWDSVVGWL